MVGPQFYSLHRCLEEQSRQLRVMISSVAERIRETRHFTAGSAREFLDVASLEHPGAASDSVEVIREPAADHDSIIGKTRSLLNDFAEKYHDPGSAATVTRLLEEHEKMGRVLKATMAPKGSS